MTPDLDVSEEGKKSKRDPRRMTPRLRDSCCSLAEENTLRTEGVSKAGKRRSHEEEVPFLFPSEREISAPKGEQASREKILSKEPRVRKKKHYVLCFSFHSLYRATTWHVTRRRRSKK